jgi:signal transduction histidine kinase
MKAAVNGRHRALSLDGESTEVADRSGPGPDLQDGLPFAARVVRGLARPRSIKARLSRILLVSLALVLVLLGLTIAGQIKGYRSATDTSRVVTVALSVQDAVHQLQRERGMTNGMLGGNQQFQPRVVAQRPKTDEALTALNHLISNPTYADLTGAQVRDGSRDLERLAEVRTQVDLRQLPAADVFAYYTSAIVALNQLDLGLDEARDPALRHGLQALYALGDVKEYSARERGLLNGVFGGVNFPVDQYQLFLETVARKQAAFAEFSHFGTAPQRQAVDAALHSPQAVQSAAMEALAKAGVTGTLPEHVDAQTWWDRMTSVIDDLRAVQQSVGKDITTRAEGMRDLALTELIAFLLAAALAVAVEVTLVIEAARSIIGPLSALVSEADEVSTHRLPDAVAALEQATKDEVQPPRAVPLQVPPQASSEIKRMAYAVGRLQYTALSLATEQAMIRHNTTASLANLGRRNQNLVRRQLGLISEFEREELDPTTLANMFELDHLATRMRRNAENLLVLVGESGLRAYSKPLPMVDVIRAALSEVEDYRRVVLKRIDDVQIVGSSVTGLAHMLAELVENGLSFSPPDVEVEIYGRKIDNRYTIAVVDHGIGMQPDALIRANARLQDEENFVVASTRFLGHYVVGRLARLTGVEVRLVQAPLMGITARLVLPPEMLANSDSDATEWPRQPTATASEVPAEGQPTENPPAAECPTPEEPPVPVAVGPDQPGPDRPRENGTTPPPLTNPLRETPHEQRVRVDVSGERTRNGLVKRSARAGRPMVVPATPLVRSSSLSQEPPRQRTPSEVASMLSSYRSGHQCGATSLTPPLITDPQPGSDPEQRGDQ